jgi:hypothetical protein
MGVLVGYRRDPQRNELLRLARERSEYNALMIKSDGRPKPSGRLPSNMAGHLAIDRPKESTKAKRKARVTLAKISFGSDE